MISYIKALKILNLNKINIKSEKILSKNSVDRIVSKNIYSPNNYPSADNTAFDGYAIDFIETKNLNIKKIKKFKIIKTIAAGDSPIIKKIPKLSTIEVMTGAVIRKPFNTIIPVEQVKYFPNEKNPKFIVLNKKYQKNQFIRFAGSDYKKGDLIIKKGDVIKPSHILAFKTLGIEKVLVKKKIKVIFYTTGNEISNKSKIPSWKVRNSNSHYLKSYLKNFPIEFKEKKILRDNDLLKFKKELNLCLKKKVDIVITSGAVSAGKFDFVPVIIKKFKLKKLFKGVSIRPGKPLMFARFKKNMSFFGLPGNPISSAACFRFFVQHYIFLCLGTKSFSGKTAKLTNNFFKKKDFTRFLKGQSKVSIKGNLEFKILTGQESFRVQPFVKSNSWGLFPAGKSKFKKGDKIKCFNFSIYEDL